MSINYAEPKTIEKDGIEYIRADLAAEREQKANDLILKLAMALWSHDPKHSLVQRAKDWLPSCEADTALATHEHNEGES